MVENEICKGCIWNNYPECKGTIYINGEQMRIDNLKSTFRCGQKDREEIMDLSLFSKSELELLKERVKELERVITQK